MVAAGESAPTPESRSKLPVVARKRTHGDRREVCGESGWASVFKPSSRDSGRGQREGTGMALHLKPDRLDLQFATKELTHDVQTPSMLSMLKPRRVAWYLVGGADLSPFFFWSDEPGAVSVRADVDWSGDAMTCKSTSAGAVQLESREIEAWSVIQQVVSFSSAVSETYAIEASRVDRWETPYHRWKQNRTIGAYPETRAEDVAERSKGAGHD